MGGGTMFDCSVYVGSIADSSRTTRWHGERLAGYSAVFFIKILLRQVRLQAAGFKERQSDWSRPVHIINTKSCRAA